MRYCFILLSSLLIFGCTSTQKTKTSHKMSKKQNLQQIVQKVKNCFQCEGSKKPGGSCYSGPGGALYNGPGGACYSGPGGALYNGPGGNMYSGPGGNRYAGPGGNCYSGPGGKCAKGLDSKSCPEICALNTKISK